MDAVATADLPDGVQSLSELIGIQTTTQAALYVGIATVALLAYEYFITLDREIECMWTGRKISVTSIFFFVNRYYPFVRAVVYIYSALNPPTTHRACILLKDFNSWSTILSLLTVEILMLLRAWALWNQRWDVGIFFIALCCGAIIAAAITATAKNLNLPRVAPLPPLFVRPCDHPPPWKYVVGYSITFVVEGISLVFMLGRILWLGSGIKRDVPILKALRTQGFYYFLVVISTMAFTVFSCYFEKLSRPVVFSGITPTITSLACTRIILELRGVLFHSGTDNPPPYASGTLPSYHGPSGNRDYHLDASRRHDHRNLSLDFVVSDPGGTTGQSASVGVYELTTFENTTFGMEVSSIAGFTGSTSSASNHDQQHSSLRTGYHRPPTATLPSDGIHGMLEEGG